MKFNDAVFGAVLLVLGLAVLVHVPSFPSIPGQKYGPGIFPGVVAAALVVCAVLLIVSGLRRRATDPWFAAGTWTRSRRHVVALVVTVVGTVAYVLLAEKVGFLIVAPILLFALFVSYGVRVNVAIVTAIVVTLVMHFAFYKLLRVPLPWGVIRPLF
ncbi:MAG: tripartite tricarboxylate transporter TctB family protein [Betaproteobacteria bacterium]